MKSPLVFLLVSCLVLAGIPSPSQSEVNPKTLNAKEKAALTALSSSDLLGQKAGDIIQLTQKLDPGTKNFFKKLEAQNTWLLIQKAGDESVAPPSWPANKTNLSSQKPEVKKEGGISTGGAVLIIYGALSVLAVAVLAFARGAGGSC